MGPERLRTTRFARTARTAPAPRSGRAARQHTARTALLLAVLGGSLLAPTASQAATHATTHAAPASAPDSVRGVLADWTHTSPARGMELYQGLIARRPGVSHWTVTLTAGGGPLRSAADARELASRLRDAGFAPDLDRVSRPNGSDRSGLLGVRVRTGNFDSREAAETRARQLADAHFASTAVEWTGSDGNTRTGRTRVNVVVLDPRTFDGSLSATYGEAVAGREKVTTMGAAQNALLAVNAGFFVMEDKDGVPGAPAGLGLYDGELQSSAINGRIALVLRGDGLDAELRRLSTVSTVSAGGETRELDGVNRRPGLIRNCGGVGGDLPTERPLHDVTCTDPDEIVQFTDELGARTPDGSGVEAVLDADGRVVALRPRGGRVPDGGSVLAGTGAGAEWLRAQAATGERVTVRHKVVDEHGRTVRTGPGDDIVNGGPQLVRDGRVAVSVGAGGFDHADDPGFAYAWALKRHPRTMVGIDDRGRLLLVSATGRHPGYSDGLSVHEAAVLMEALGAETAMNLDGGGSTSMALGGELLNRPSDATGERAVGDALLLRRG